MINLTDRIKFTKYLLSSNTAYNKNRNILKPTMILLGVFYYKQSTTSVQNRFITNTSKYTVNELGINKILFSFGYEVNTSNSTQISSIYVR
jgi:hypothetical protein